jgi:ribosomal protein L37AE/L43A
MQLVFCKECGYREYIDEEKTEFWVCPKCGKKYSIDEVSPPEEPLSEMPRFLREELIGAPDEDWPPDPSFDY